MKKFVLWKDLKHIIDEDEKISSIEFKVKPDFLYGGIRNFKLTKDKKIEIGYIDEHKIDTTYFVEDSIFNNIEDIIQVLNLEELDSRYNFAITDGVNFEVEIITNKISKNIDCKGSLPQGLDNLFGYIDYVFE